MLEYDMVAARLKIQSKAPTIVLCGILKLAQDTAPEVIPEEGTDRRIQIDYDMLTDAVVVKTDTTKLIYRGMLEMAFSMITHSQVMRMLQSAGAAVRARSGNIPGGN